MKKSKVLSTEEEFREWAREKNLNKVRQLIDYFLEFWRDYDFLQGTNHEIIIRKLYFGASQNLLAVALCVHVEEQTLYRYRTKYMDFFCHLREKHVLLF